MFKFKDNGILNSLCFSQKSNGWFGYWLELYFESVIRTLFLAISESIRFIGSADPLKLLLKSAIRRKFLAKSADPQTLSPSPFSRNSIQPLSKQSCIL